MAGTPAAAMLPTAMRAGIGSEAVPRGAQAESAAKEAKQTLIAWPSASAASITLISTSCVVVDGRLERRLRLVAVIGRDRQQQRGGHQRAVEVAQGGAVGLAALLGVAGGEHGLEQVGGRFLQRAGRRGAVVGARLRSVDGHRPQPTIGRRIYIRKTPKRVSPIGALSAALIPMASTRRVSSGSITPSSHSRAVE